MRKIGEGGGAGGGWPTVHCRRAVVEVRDEEIGVFHSVRLPR